MLCAILMLKCLRETKKRKWGNFGMLRFSVAKSLLWEMGIDGGSLIKCDDCLNCHRVLCVQGIFFQSRRELTKAIFVEFSHRSSHRHTNWLGTFSMFFCYTGNMKNCINFNRFRLYGSFCDRNNALIRIKSVQIKIGSMNNNRFLHRNTLMNNINTRT